MSTKSENTYQVLRAYSRLHPGIGEKFDSRRVEPGQANE